LGGICPYGYRVEGVKSAARLVPDTDPLVGAQSAADIVRLTYDLCGRQGWSTTRTADHLNAAGVPPAYVKDGREVSKGTRTGRTAGIWRPGCVRLMLTQTVYRGEYTYGKRTRRSRPAIVIGRCEALVSGELWAAAQQTLSDNRIAATLNPRRRFLLRTLIRCGNCGKRYCGAWHRRDAKVWYKCSGKMHRIAGAEACIAASVSGDLIEPVVLDDIFRALRDPGGDLIAELESEPEARPQAPPGPGGPGSPFGETT
jgi:site-specific DNA recombinase